MRKNLLTLLFCCLAALATAQVQRPKLVVGIVVDQMRWDYLYYYYDKFGDGGFKRLLNEGFSCDNQMINYLPTVTAIGHASVYTGSVPALHGIAGNNFYLNGKNVYCCTDDNVKGLGSDHSAARMSPHNMVATTIGDQLKLATDFRSKVIGVAMKDRAAILPAGHSADAAYWYDNAVGHFVSSSYYMDKLPAWVEDFNKQNNSKPGLDLKATNEGVTMTFKMAEAALDNEQLGKHDVTDMLCVSISSTDVIAHAHSTRGKENYEVYMQTDKDLAHFLSKLDAQVGKGNYLVFLTADHAGAHNPNFLNKHRIPGGGWDSRAAISNINKALSEKYGVEGRYICDLIDYRLYVDHKLLADHHIDLQTVKDDIVSMLKEDQSLDYVVDFDKAAQTAMPEFLRERTINGYNRNRSGDIMVVTHPETFAWKVAPDYGGTTHGAWNPYDAHIPLIFMGWHVKHGSTSQPTFMVDTAPTVCAMLKIQMPNACIGNAILPVVENGAAALTARPVRRK